MKQGSSFLKNFADTVGGNRHKILLVIAVEMVIVLFAVIFTTSAFAAQEFWELNIGGKTIATMKSENDADKAIELVKEHYVTEGARNVEAVVDPEVTVSQRYYAINDATPALSSPEDAADFIVTANDEGKDLLQVVVTQTVDESKTMGFDTVYKKSDNVAQNTTLTKSKGKKGETVISVEQVTVNGEVVDEKTVSTKVVKEPKNKVIVTGTGSQAASKGAASSDYGEKYSLATGKKIAEFALQFVGNPYKYGGSSLTHGADCSGFVMAVYDHFGIGLPHDAGADRSYGVGVSLDEAQPGDLICFRGHIGIYIGNNQIVHAMDEKHGITVSTIGYNGKPILTIRRIFC